MGYKNPNELMLFIICTGEKKKKGGGERSEGVFIGHPGKGVSFTSSQERGKRLQVERRAERSYWKNANERGGRMGNIC